MDKLAIPIKFVGPIEVDSLYAKGKFSIPLATYEYPLWPSVNRGASVSRAIHGLRAIILKDEMTRSILLRAKTINQIQPIISWLEKHFCHLQTITTQTSKYAKLRRFHTHVVGNLLYVRFSFETGDAAGHNMATKAAEALLNYILESQPELNYGSISGNFCTDKKVSAVNSILGRGKYVCVEGTIPKDTCLKILKTTPESIVQLNYEKNLLGSTIAGSMISANAHFANMLLAFYLATGQDGANIIEGSQGIVHTQLDTSGLYFSVTLPNIIIGSVGNGKDIPQIQGYLSSLGCTEAEANPGGNAKKLAVLAACAVWCGEISLLAAQTTPGALMRSHEKYERQKKML